MDQVSGYRSSPSISPSPKKKLPGNAFDVMLANAHKNKDKPKKKFLEKSEFVEAEAQESDDEDMFGFGLGKKDDGDDEDGEDLDKTLDGLVDDAEMDEKTKGVDLVLEKVK